MAATAEVAVEMATAALRVTVMDRVEVEMVLEDPGMAVRARVVGVKAQQPRHSRSRGLLELRRRSSP